MGLFGKIKNILFEEEEIEVPVRESKKIDKSTEEIVPAKVTEEKLEKAKKVVDSTASVDTFDKEPIFNFPDFDEDEFESTLPKFKEEKKIEDEKPAKLYVEHQREIVKEEIKPKDEQRHKTNIRSIGKTYSPIEKGTKSVPSKKFVPSPIISPVYGILDKDYHPDDISTRAEVDIKRSVRLDVDKVRKKAFEQPEELPKKKTVKKVEEDILENEDKLISKTVDELLTESAEEVVNLDEQLNVEKNIKEIEDELDKIDDELVLDDKPKKKDDSDTLEQDLFELIDSMYEDDKEEE